MAFSTVRMNTPNRKRNKSSYDSGATFSVPSIACDTLTVAQTAVVPEQPMITVVDTTSAGPWATQLPCTFTFTKSSAGVVTMSMTETADTHTIDNKVTFFSEVVPVGYRPATNIMRPITVWEAGTQFPTGYLTVYSIGFVDIGDRTNTIFTAGGKCGLDANTVSWKV